MLGRLPPELLCHVYHLLPQPSVNQVSLTCRSLYASALPVLYATVVLSHRTHIRQLETGLQKTDGVLRQVLQDHTTELVLKCKQSGQYRLLFDSRPLLSQLPHLRSLSLVNFHMLPVDYVIPILSLLPHLDNVSIRYCDLIADLPSVSRLSSSINMPTSRQQYQYEQLGELKHQRSLSVTTLELYWTDFSKAAVDSLLSIFPSITKVRLLANHNQHYLANNYALQAIQQHCPHIMDLEIGLQEVKEQALVDCIKSYGSQLRRLSIRYHSPLTLFAVTKYAPLVQDLTIRFSLETKWYPCSSSSSTSPASSHSRSSAPTHRIPRLPYTTTRPHLHQRQQHDQQDDEQEIRKKGGLLFVLYKCQHLVRVQVESMHPSQSHDDLPPVVRKALAIVARKRVVLNYSIQAFNNVIQNNDKFFSRTHYHKGTLTQPETTKMAAVLATTLLLRKLSTSTPTNKHQYDGQKRNASNGLDVESIVHHQQENQRIMDVGGDNTNNTGVDDEKVTSTEIFAPPSATISNDSSENSRPRSTSGTQRHRQWKNSRNRMKTILVLDNEQLKEIRYQAVPFI
ncbi:unnamed protein product [Absidia cylindrospora]